MAGKAGATARSGKILKSSGAKVKIEPLPKYPPDVNVSDRNNLAMANKIWASLLFKAWRGNRVGEVVEKQRACYNECVVLRVDTLANFHRQKEHPYR